MGVKSSLEDVDSYRRVEPVHIISRILLRALANSIGILAFR